MMWKTFWADSRGKVSIVLMVLWLMSLMVEFRVSHVAFPLFAIAGSYALDALLSRLRWGVWFFSLSSLITGLLIGLVLEPTSVRVLAGAVTIASLSKCVLGFGRQKHVFNPAALGILVASLISNQPVAWWGATWGTVATLIICLGMIVPLRQLRRLWMPISFLLVYGVTLALLSGVQNALKLTLDGTVFLFAWVMVPEPITAPSRGLWRYGWGVFVSIFVIVQQIFSVSGGDPLLAALLLANGIGFLLTRVV